MTNDLREALAERFERIRRDAARIGAECVTADAIAHNRAVLAAEGIDVPDADAPPNVRVGLRDLYTAIVDDARELADDIEQLLRNEVVRADADLVAYLDGARDRARQIAELVIHTQ